MNNENLTIKFWVFYNNSPVKLRLLKGESISFGKSERSEEGWNSEHYVYERTNDQLFRSTYLDGKDCDGRLSQEYHEQCKPGNEYAFKITTGHLTPLWEEFDSSQHDYYAEAMGY